ncbi:flavodoxin [Kitasatospora sp. NPDC001664]|uniref:flavodoxin n=1 Tax=Kitasatospora albolonga TaxID=68173 RepID=UPI0031EC32F7
MAEILHAEVRTPAQADPAELAAAELVGFGSGVFHGRMRPTLAALARTLPTGPGRAFVFATSGFPEVPFAPFTRPLVRRLEAAGRHVEPAFSCRALDTWLPFRPFGGLHPDRPGPDDLAAARAYARGLRG